MKRKRFIKLLMWAGMSRNDAAACAALARKAGRSYFKALGDLFIYHMPQFKYIDEVHTWPAGGGKQ